MSEMKRMDVEVVGMMDKPPAPSGPNPQVTFMFIFSLCISIVAVVLGGVAISRTNTPAPIVPSVTNNIPTSVAPTPAPVTPTPPTPMQPTPGPQQSLVRRNTATGNQAAFYLLSFYNGDASCSQVSKVYDPIQDPLNIGLYSNPIRIDRAQSDCFSIAYGVSWGVVSATSRYLSFRQFASNDCSGSFKDFVRMISPSMQSAPGTCFSFSVTSAVQLFYRVAVANPSVSALGYKLPSFGHEEMDYDPVTGKVWMTTAYEKDSVFSVDLARTADATRPTQFGGVGYATVEQHTLNGDAYFTNVGDTSSGPALIFKTLGVRGCGEQTSKCLKRIRIIRLRPRLLSTQPFPPPQVLRPNMPPTWWRAADPLFVIAFGSPVLRFSNYESLSSNRIIHSSFSVTCWSTLLKSIWWRYRARLFKKLKWLKHSPTGLLLQQPPNSH